MPVCLQNIHFVLDSEIQTTQIYFRKVDLEFSRQRRLSNGNSKTIVRAMEAQIRGSHKLRASDLAKASQKSDGSWILKAKWYSAREIMTRRHSRQWQPYEHSNKSLFSELGKQNTLMLTDCTDSQGGANSWMGRRGVC